MERVRVVLRFLARGIRKLLLLLLLVAIIVIGVSTIIGWSINQTATNPDMYHGLIERNHLGERAPMAATNVLITYAKTTNYQGSSFLDKYPVEAWEVAANLLLPEGWLDHQLHTFVDAFFLWYDDSGGPLPDFTLELSPIGQTFLSPRGISAILPLLENEPLCSRDQTHIQILSGRLASCIPNDRDITYIAEEINQNLAESLPEYFSLSELHQEGIIPDSTIHFLDTLRSSRQTVEETLMFGLGLSITLLLFYGLIYSLSVRGFSGAIPLPLFVTGGLSLLLLAILYLILTPAFQAVIQIALPPMPSASEELLRDLVQDLFRSLRKPWLTISLILIGLATGIQLMLFGFDRYKANHAAVDKPIPPQRRIRKQYRY